MSKLIADEIEELRRTTHLMEEGVCPQPTTMILVQATADDPLWNAYPGH